MRPLAYRARRVHGKTTTSNDRPMVRKHGSASTGRVGGARTLSACGRASDHQETTAEFPVVQRSSTQ
ncbi:MAG: hypothetical protein HC828_09250 [Blastochloris sp.]|nr:hypothetical protein [Blastochloris sp.]